MKLALLLSLLPVALVSADDWCGPACLSGASTFEYPECDESVAYYDCFVQTPQRMGSLVLCISDHCRNPHAAWGKMIWYIEEAAPQVKKLKNDFEVLLANATQYAIPAPANLTEVLYNPAHLTDEMFAPILKAETSWDESITRYSEDFAWVFLMFAAVVVAGAALRHAWFRFRSHRSVDGRNPKAAALGVYTKKYLLMPAIFHSTSHRPSLFGFTWSLPTRLQSILVFFLIMINAIACGWDLHLYKENIWFENVKEQALRYVADRTGKYAIYNLPLMFAFAGRNNILIWLTGSTFDTFNVFHKWLGRIVVLQAIVHSALYTWIFLPYGYAYVAEEYKEPWLRWGAVATVAGGLILGQAVHVSRKYFYETFLVFHILLAIFYIVGTWYHVYLLDYKVMAKWGAYLSWVIGACAVWGLDRFLRLLRLAIFNFNWHQGKFQTTVGTVKALTADLYAIDIKMAHDFKFSPGQYCFLHFGTNHYILQSHPFTIIGYEEDTQPSLTDDKSLSRSSGTNTPSEHSTGEKTLSLVVRKHKGATKQLPNLSTRGPSFMMVEGPYGQSLSLHNYDNVTLLAAGVGITAVIPHTRQAIAEAHHFVHFVWIVHHLEEVNALCPYLLRCQHAQLKVSIFVTASKDSEKKASVLPQEAFQDLNIVIGQGRPVVADILASDATEAGSWAVVACGPGGLLDDARAACVGLLAKKAEVIDFFSEGFEW